MKIKIPQFGNNKMKWREYPTDEEVSAFIRYTLTAVEEGDWEKIGNIQDKIKEFKLERTLAQSEIYALNNELRTLKYYSEEKSGSKIIGQLTKIIVMLLKGIYYNIPTYKK